MAASASSYNLLDEFPSDDDYDYVIVGCGLSGSVVAERLATQCNKKSVLIDKRDHIGGNCYDYRNKWGILMSKYGPHLFHTNFEHVWEYINKFTEWQRWEQITLGHIDGQFVSIPPNITTVNRVCGANLRTVEEMDEWLAKNQVKYDEEPKNGEEMAKSRVGEVLYEKIFKHYTKKQWDRFPEELNASVLARIPVRNNFDTRYFADKYQALPKRGYTSLFEGMLNHPNIRVCVNCNFFEMRHKIRPGAAIIYTGPIDHYFAESGLPSLEYRSLDFEEENYENLNYYQPGSIINHPGPEVPWTRIVEYKHFLNQQSPHTTIVKEFSKADGDPYYPVPNERNLSLYEKYRTLAEKEKGIYFLGRLANYKYFNMDQAIANALEFFDNLVKENASLQGLNPMNGCQANGAGDQQVPAEANGKK